MSKTKALRLSDRENHLVEQFIKKNPIFDFSSLARTAILHFIENPKIEIKPVFLQKEVLIGTDPKQSN